MVKNFKNFTNFSKIFLLITGFLLFLSWIFLPVFTTKTPSFLVVYDTNQEIFTWGRKGGGLHIPQTYNTEDIFIQRIIATEDKRFFSHSGIDILAKLSALKENISSLSFVRGGSTITEQYIKNRYFLNQKRTLVQKFRESIFALSFELIFSKETLLNNFLNTVYFGNGFYGLESASQGYFGLPYDKLSDTMHIFLLTRVKYPGNPFQETEKRKFYQKIVCERLSLPCPSSYPENLFSPLKKTPYLPLSSSGKIFTHINKDFQTFASEKARKTLNILSEKGVNMLSVLIKNPQTKETFVHLTMSHKGTPSLDFSAQKRSYGSLLKPLLLGFLLEEGFSENTGILDTEYQYSLPNGESYRPQNYGLKSGGFLTLKEAVASSFNQSSVLAVSYNLPKFFQFLENLGAQFSKTQENIGLSVILGGGELSLQNIVTLYENFLISSRIKTETKKSVFLALKDEKLREKGFRNRLRTPSFLQFAVKTGTASYFTDNTLIAFRPDLIIGISLGNNTGTPLHNIDGVSGTESLFQELAMYALQNGFSQKHEWDRDTALNILPVCLEDFLFPELTYKKILEKKEYQNTVSFCDEKNIPQKVYQFLPDTSVIIQKKDIARELQKIPFSFSDTGTFTLNEKIYENFTQGFFDLPFGKSSYSHETEFGVIEGEIEVRGEW